MEGYGTIANEQGYFPLQPLKPIVGVRPRNTCLLDFVV